MLQLKDIASRMDNCHVRTAKRNWKKLDSIQERLGRPRVCPDVVGRGPHRWENATADLLIQLWKSFYTYTGTTPAILRAKFAAQPTDNLQLPLPLNFDAQKIRKIIAQKISIARKAVRQSKARRRRA